MKSGFVGMVGVFCLIVPAIALGGGGIFLNVPSLVICLLMPISLSLASAGAPDLGRALRALRCLLVFPRKSDLTAQNSHVLRHMISYAYAACVIGMLIGWIRTLSQPADPAVLHLSLSMSILTMLYAIVISECILRPAARRIEGAMEKRNEQPKRLCGLGLRTASQRAPDADRSLWGPPRSWTSERREGSLAGRS